MKRVIDIALCSGALAALSPVMAFTAAAIRLDSPGPVIFRQQRLGLGGRPFTMCKFRTMYVGAEASGVYEATGDVRVTRLGRVLRRTSLDELPQLVNIPRTSPSGDVFYHADSDVHPVVAYLPQNPKGVLVEVPVINLPLWQAPDYSTARLFNAHRLQSNPGGIVIDGHRTWRSASRPRFVRSAKNVPT
ncbi:sugar transferase [Fodinibacter luteus]